MSSQTTQPPACPDHGYMVPIDYEMCLLNDAGLVIATVEFRDDGPNGQIYPAGFAVDEEAQAELPSDDQMGDEIFALQEAGRLVSIYDIMDGGEGFLRIDDCRPGQLWSYLIWDQQNPVTGDSFIPGVVYHSFDMTDDDRHDFPGLESFDDVLALTRLPEARWITGYDGDFAAKSKDDADVVAELGDLNIGVIVWDRGAMQRHGEQRRASTSN